MSMVLSFLIKGADAGGKAAVAGMKKEVQSTKVETTKLDAATRKASQSNGLLARSANSVRSKLSQLRTTATGWIAKLRQVDNTQKLAAGSVGNLTAQFNDIGVMMAAGQNPLQLAIQQGTQITQVIGPMGAAGAAKALKTAFVALFSPVNLITLGMIAAGATAVQWLTRSKEEAETLNDTLKDTAAAVDAFATKAGQARLSTQDMFAEFGTASPELRAVLRDMAELAKIDAFRGIDNTADAIRDQVFDLSWWDDRSGMSAAQDFLGLSSMKSSAREAGLEFARNLELLSRSEDPAVKLRAALDLRGQLLDAAGGLERLNTQQRQFYEGLVSIVRDGSILDAASDRLAPEQAARAEYYQSRVAAEQYLANARAQEAAELAKIYGVYARTRIESDAHLSVAQQMLDKLNQEVALRQSILRHGEGSKEVADLMAAASRADLEAKLQTVDASEAMKDQIRQAFELSEQLAAMEAPGWLAIARSEAAALADQLGVSVGLAAQLAQVGQPKGNNNTIQGFEANDPRNPNGPIWTDGYSTSWKPWTPKTSKTGQGGGASQSNQAERLIQQLQRELAVMRETDPVQKELLRNREALAGATEEQRKSVQDLIAQKMQEAQVSENQSALMDLLGQTSTSVLDAITDRANNASNALENLTVSIGAALAKAWLLGEGPLAGLFGGAGTGGVIGKWLGLDIATSTAAQLPAMATGGRVRGPGTDTSDDVLAWLSNDEHVVNAKDARKNRPLLEMINTGVPVLDILRSGRRLQGYADGGVVGGGASMRKMLQPSGYDREPPQLVFVDNRSSADITAKQETVTDAQGRRSQQMVLADAVGSALQTPGGGAANTLKHYGLKPKVPLR